MHCCGVGLEITVESLRKLTIVIEHIVICSIHTDIAVFILVSYMVAELVEDSFRCHRASTEAQYGLRHDNGVSVWEGDILTLRDYETAALCFRAHLKPGEQERAVARLWANLQEPAKEVVRTCKPQDFEDYKRMIKSDVAQVKSSETTS